MSKARRCGRHPDELVDEDGCEACDLERSRDLVRQSVRDYLKRRTKKQPKVSVVR
jgi:hypothetical protein